MRTKFNVKGVVRKTAQPTIHDGQKIQKWEYECLACRREQEIRREEREPICELFELWRTSSKRITFVDKESSVQWKRIWNSLVDKLTESGDYRALPEREGGKESK